MKNNTFERKLSPVKKWLKKHFWLVTIVSIIVSMTWTLWLGLQQSVWFDEAYSVTVAEQSVSDITRLAAADTHPPLYYILLHAWMGMFGSEEAAVRSLSVLAYGGALFVAVAFMKRQFGLRAAYLTLGLAVISPLLMRYGFEVRMYSWAALIGIAATYVLTSNWKWKWPLYALLVAVGMATLYNLVYLWLTHALWLFIRDLKAKKLSWKAPWLWAYVLSVVLFLPQLPTFLTQLSNGALAPISEPLTLVNLFGIISFNTVYQPFWALGPVVSLLVLAVFIAIIVLVVRGWKLLVKYPGKSKVSWLVAMYMIVPVVLLAIISIFKPMYVERYLSHVALGGVMLVALLAALVSRKKMRIAVVSISIIAVASIVGVWQLVQVGNFNFQRMQRPDIQASLEDLDCNDDSVIVAAGPYEATEVDYYANGCRVFFYSPSDSLGGGYAPFNGSAMQLKNTKIGLVYGTIYYIYYGEPELEFPEHTLTYVTNVDGSLHVAHYEKE